MPETDRAGELLHALQQGDPQAAEELFRRYAARLTRLAETHLHQRVQQRADGEDVVQSVFRTFFRRGAAGEFQIDSSGQLWQLLVTITVRKACALARQHRAAMRDVAREATEGEEWLREVTAREPGPDEATILVDEIERLLQGLPEEYGRILAARLESRNVADIAQEMAVARQTVYRALDVLKRRLAETDLV